MKVQDYAQNLPIRLGTIQVLAFVFLAVLGIRLYHLQINRGEDYRVRAENQRIRMIPIPAPRGAIFDRNGKLLVDSRSTYNVTLTHEAGERINPMDRVDEYAKGLSVEREFLVERINLLKTRPDYETLVLKENATLQDITWVETRTLEFPELRIELQPQRFYPHGLMLAHVLGYVGEISPAQLEKQEYGHLKPGDIIGKGGLEQFYDKFLRGTPGYRKVIVDSRGRVQSEIDYVPPQSGQDLYTTIDLDLQIAAEEQLAISASKRGAIIAMDPRDGGVLAMASAPSFDPNIFVQGSATKEGRKQIAAYWQDETRPLYNRAIQGRYHPGSTWKIPESVAALRQGVVTVQDSNLACGGGITIGNKFTRCMGNHGAPPLKYAITKSCDGYYYRLALKMGIDGLVQMVETFEYDKRTGIDLPNEKISRTPKYYREIVEKRSRGRWPDIETVFASIGQVTVDVTPIAMLRAVTSVGIGGKLMVPHFMKEFKSIGAIGKPGEPNYVPAKEAFEYEAPEIPVVSMTEEQNKLVLDGMYGVVHAGGTATRISMGGEFEIAGKTGTAQVTVLGKDVGELKDHAWFIGFAPAYAPEIAVVAIIENVGFGGTHAAPAVKGIFEAYVKKNRVAASETAVGVGDGDSPDTPEPSAPGATPNPGTNVQQPPEIDPDRPSANIATGNTNRRRDGDRPGENRRR
ncbi:MAG: penicillin-binding protein 2 [Acidobacteria bacterium]|nr:MAG: penicillin-binding protein 2 [Acidobacteriota bacterium]REK02965.1 MAG: penicillin-binding protein 2 [Acidobacteriota bacterium]REK13231.1 MAG: penicillin-binding protein 2 [Acidobacteriota bacterium]REK41225.1 MAG: penicillin-binding protein 2 [Acidobacteriota bacterium]